MNPNTSDSTSSSIQTAKDIEFTEMYGDYWWVSYPVDLTIRHAERIVMQRTGGDATHVGTIYKRDGRFYFMCQVNKTSPRFEWTPNLLIGIGEKLNELNNATPKEVELPAFKVPWE